jgi:hypothetical protein
MFGHLIGATMNTKLFLIGTVVGGTAILVAGFLLFAVPPLNTFYVYAMTAGAATGVARDPLLLWAVFAGALSYGALVTLAIGSRTHTVSVPAGIRIGAAVGFLLWFTADFMLFGISNVGTLTSAMLSPLLEMVPGAIAGGFIAAVVGRPGASRPVQAGGETHA